MADDVESIQTLVEEPKGPFKDEADKALFALLNGQMASEFDPNENVVLLREWKHRYFLEHRVFVDPKSLIYIDGTEMDYVKQGLNEGFEFKNPNVQAECGCGESFTV